MMHPAASAASAASAAAAMPFRGRRLTRLTSEHRRNIDARYRSPLHFLELWSITDALSRRRGSTTTTYKRGREGERMSEEMPSPLSRNRHSRG